MNVGDEEGVTNANVLSFIVAKSAAKKILRSEALLDENRSALAANRVDMFLLEPADSGKVAPLSEPEESSPERPH